MKPYQVIIGLEIHIEIKTESKMFSVAPNDPFHSEANQNVTPVCIGMPGTLPVPNQEAINQTLRLGLALGCQIPKESKFDRKHYFYPDLPKGYQISQYDQPLCEGGQVTVKGQPVRLIRIHLEEDAGKLIHVDGHSAVDLNRAGVPLMEIVTEPDITSPSQAREFLTELRLLARTLGISNADMEKGELRCDANVNIAFAADGKTVKTRIVEIKNLNSFKMVERATTYEAERLYQEWQDDPAARVPRAKITVGWNDAKGITVLQRTKEEAADYRYFPEPDIPPLRIYDGDHNDPAPKGALFDLAKLRSQLGVLPDERREIYRKLGIGDEDINTILARPWAVVLIEEIIDQEKDPALVKKAFTHLVHDAVEGVKADQVMEVVRLVQMGEISSNIPKLVYAELATKPHLQAEELIDQKGWRQQSDDMSLTAVILEVIKEQPNAVADVKGGKQQSLGYLIGQVMAKTNGSANPQRVRDLLIKKLSIDD